uniref:Uncharacterized protein n=1 Tax=Hyaloperonospora arabidopsidis (strain Emoy2) TaxID=559515 RepID=M4BFM5_HYAAE
MTGLTPPSSPPPPSDSSTEHTPPLQQECNALYTKVKDLTHLLAQERAAKAILESEVQLRERELRHMQQHSALATQQALDRQGEAEKDLENEVAMHEMAVLGRNAATQKSATLAAELEAMEIKWKEERGKMEVARAEAALASVEVQRLKEDRRRLVRRIESDAKRVRELWQQIAREHEVKVEALHLDLEKAQQLSRGVKQTESDFQLKMDESKEAEQTSWEEVDRGLETKQHRPALELQRVRDACKLHVQREEAAVKERDAAVLAACKAREDLDARNEELRMVKTKFADLLHKYEEMDAQYKRSVREREAQFLVRTQHLRKGKHYAEEVSRLWKERMAGYEQVIYAIDTRLTEVQELSEDVRNSAWSIPREASTSKASSCIHRH